MNSRFSRFFSDWFLFAAAFFMLLVTLWPLGLVWVVAASLLSAWLTKVFHLGIGFMAIFMIAIYFTSSTLLMFISGKIGVKRPSTNKNSRYP